MKKVLTLFSVILILSVTSCTKPEEMCDDQDVLLKEKSDPVSVPLGDPLTQSQVDQTIIGLLESRNDFQWEWLDLKTLWSAMQYGDQSVSIGYKPASEGDISSKIHTIKVQTGEYKQVHDALLDLIVDELNKTSTTPVSLNEILIEDDPVLPIITVRLTDRNVITKLYNLLNVRYIEPLDYWPANVQRVASNEGCNASTTGVNAADFTTITPAARLPWNFNNHTVPAAWTSGQGQGISIGVIDAGLSSSQTLLNGSFNDGESNVGRTVTTDFTLGTSPFNSCYHGTAMSGLAAGPRNTLNATTGVAYKSNLHFIRACNDVILDGSSERTAVKNACVKMGDRSDIDVISMSIGSPFSYGVLRDGVDY